MNNHSYWGNMPDSIQEQLMQARRNQILDAASQVFADKGFHPTTIKDIAKVAGIADGTIYNYFKNKTALLIGIFDRMRTAVEPDETMAETLVQADLRTFLTAFIQLPLTTLNDKDFQLFRIVVSEMMVNDDLRTLYHEQILQPTLAIAETYLQQWVDERQITAIDVSLTVSTIASLIMGLMMQNIMGDPTLQKQWDTLPEFIVNMLIDGLELEAE